MQFDSVLSTTCSEMVYDFFSKQIYELIWLHLVPFCNQVEMNSAPNLLGAQTGLGVADDQSKERAWRLLKFCQFLKYLGMWLKTQFEAIVSTQWYLLHMIVWMQ